MENKKKCPNCGADLSYDKHTNTYTCQYCDIQLKPNDAENILQPELAVETSESAQSSQSYTAGESSSEGRPEADGAPAANAAFINNAENPDFQTASKKRKGRKRHGCLFSIIKFLLIAALIVGGIVAIVVGINEYRERKEQERIILDFQSAIPNLNMTDEDILEEEAKTLQETPSDISGMSQWDKVEMGLQPGDGADSDGDGLTDKDEMELYHSDPLKASSSDDGIPDGVKVANGLEVDKKYSTSSSEYQQTMDLYPEYVTFKDRGKADNALANIWEKEYYSFSGIQAVKAYSIIEYSGKVEIDFSDAMNENAEYTAYRIMDGEEEEVELKNGIASFKVDGECVIALVKKADLVEKDNSVVNFTDIYGKSGKDTMIISIPLLQYFGGEDDVAIYVYENNWMKGDQTHIITDATLAAALGYTKTDVKIQYSYMSPMRYAVAQRILHSFFSYDWLEESIQQNVGDDSDEVMEVTRSVMHWVVQFYDIQSEDLETFWQHMQEKAKEESEQPKEEEEVYERPSTYVTTFRVAKDALPFPNFGSYISAGGNCAGFSLITMQLFNKDLYELTATDTFFKDEDGGTEYSYDITDIEEMKTFLDRYLDDYKTAMYWRETYPDMDKLQKTEFTDNDAAFLDFIGYKWAEANDKMDRNVRFWGETIPWSNFKNLMDYFKNNDKILYVSIQGSEKSGPHAINAYGIEQDPNDSDVYYILVYDNNFPNNVAYSSSGAARSVDCRIKVTRYNPLIGDDYIEWEYCPSSKYLPDYKYGSYWRWGDSDLNDVVGTVVQYHCLSLFDENFNRIMG